MNPLPIELIVQWLGGLLAYITLGVVFYGVWRGTQRRAGRIIGKMGHFLRSPWFYLISSALYFGICYISWIPLPLSFSPQTRTWMLSFGSLLYFPGMSMVLWGRLALGKNYFVSTGFGAQLFTSHQLIKGGPYAFVRHPMYLGLMLAAFGSLLMYATWTTLFFVCFAPLMIFRARREEAVLAVEFGEEWQEYCKRVPAFIPHWRKEL